MHKKAIAIILSILLYSFLPSIASAANISIPDTHVFTGETIEVPVMVDTISSLAGFQMTVTYDPSVLQSTGAAYGDLSPSPDWLLVQDPPAPNGQITIGAFDEYLTGSSGSNVSLLKLKFNVIGNLLDTSGINITSIMLSDLNGLEIPSSVNLGGSFCIWGYGTDIIQDQMSDLPTISSSYSIGQTFTAVNNSIINTIGIYVADINPGEPLNSLTIEIYDGIYTSGGSLIGSTAFSPSSGNVDWVDVDFSSQNILLTAGQTYSIKITTQTSRWAVGKNLHSSFGNDYIGGDAIISGSIDNNNDLSFRVIAKEADSDNDGIMDDGDRTCVIADSPCTGGNTANCDDNCRTVSNPSQVDTDGDMIGDACEPSSCLNDPSLNCGGDSDGDGMADSFELRYGLNPNDANDADIDSDRDGLTNLQEAQAGSDPLSQDSDGDAVKDGIDQHPADPSKVWTDENLLAGTTYIKAVHFIELRNAINILRHLKGLGLFSWTDPTLTPQSSSIKSSHIIDLRTALEEVYGTRSWTDGTIQQGLSYVKAIHIQELRRAVEGQVLLINADEAAGTGTDGGVNEFTNSSGTSLTITTRGNTQSDESQKKYGNASLYFDGDNDYLEITDHPYLDYSYATGTSEAWSFSAWVMPQAGTSEPYTIFSQATDSDIYYRLSLEWYTGLLLNGESGNYSLPADSSMNTKTLTRDGKTSLLLHGIDSNLAETNGSQDIFDSSPTGHTLSVAGTGTKISTSNSKFGGSSIFFDGINDYLTAPAHTDFDLSGTWTIEGWINPTTVSGSYASIVSQRKLSSSAYYQIRINTDYKLRFIAYNAAANPASQAFSSTVTISTGTWTHFRMVCDGSFYYMFINGSLDKKEAITVAIIDMSTEETHISHYPSSYIGWFHGFIDDFAIYKGLAKSTSSFTPLTRRNAAAEITTAITGETGEDPSFGNGAISFTGEDYLYHAGSSDFNIQDNIFTVEAFLNPDKISGTQTYFHLWTGSYLGISVISTGAISATFYNGSWTNVQGGTLSVGIYTHVAVVGDGTNLLLYVNGNQVDSSVIAGTNPSFSTAELYIGTDASGSNAFRGLIDDFKISLNARYSGATITVPTAEDKDIAHLKFEVSNSGSVDSLEGPNDNISTDNFHHVEISGSGDDSSGSGDTHYLFTDGILQASGDLSSGIEDYTNNFMIGVHHDPGPPASYINAFKGWIDEIEIKRAAGHTQNFVP